MKKSPKPKHLTFSEMWQLYKLIGGHKQEVVLLDEISTILQGMSQENFLKSISMLYKEKIDFTKTSPLGAVSLLVDGLSYNNFYDFSYLISGLTNK